MPLLITYFEEEITRVEINKIQLELAKKLKEISREVYKNEISKDDFNERIESLENELRDKTHNKIPIERIVSINKILTLSKVLVKNIEKKLDNNKENIGDKIASKKELLNKIIESELTPTEKLEAAEKVRLEARNMLENYYSGKSNLTQKQAGEIAALSKPIEELYLLIKESNNSNQPKKNNNKFESKIIELIDKLNKYLPRNVPAGSGHH